MILRYDTHDIEIAARTMYGEARGEGARGMALVCDVLFNRATDRRWGKTISAVAQQKWQFSCWNMNDPNRDKLLRVTTEDPSFRIALSEAAYLLQRRNDGDPSLSNDANHYLTRRLFQTRPPSWADKDRIVLEVGTHVFLNL